MASIACDGTKVQPDARGGNLQRRKGLPGIGLARAILFDLRSLKPVCLLEPLNVLRQCCAALESRVLEARICRPQAAGFALVAGFGVPMTRSQRHNGRLHSGWLASVTMSSRVWKRVFDSTRKRR